jgi:hypothetical protein
MHPTEARKTGKAPKKKEQFVPTAVFGKQLQQ